MFFLINLVFASNDTRIITTRDIVVDDLMVTVPSDFLSNNNILDPVSKYNVNGYIIRDNGNINITYANKNIVSPTMKLKVYYYKKFKSKYIKVMCFEDSLAPSNVIELIPDDLFVALKSTKRINDTLFIIDVKYDRQYGKEPIESVNKKYYFRYVTNRQYELYKEMQEEESKAIEETRIFRPKKQTN